MIVDRKSIIKYTNSREQSITFDCLAGQRTRAASAKGVYFLNRADEALPNTINADRVVDWHGENVQSMYAGVRSVDLQGIIFHISGTPAVITQRKRELERLFNPTLTGEIEYRRDGEFKAFYLRNCRCESKINFTVVPGGLMWNVTLRAHDPFWQQRTELERLSFVQKNAIFPRSYPQVYNTGGINPVSGRFYFGLKRSSLSTVVNNLGDVETGFELVFSALGELENPSITNLDTGETIRLLLTMEKDDTVKIINMPKEFKVIMKDGSNGAKYLDTAVTVPFTLPTGRTHMRFSADLNVSFLDVLLRYPPQFIGAENF